jgi:hypothetical protein
MEDESSRNPAWNDHLHFMYQRALRAYIANVQRGYEPSMPHIEVQELFTAVRELAPEVFEAWLQMEREQLTDALFPRFAALMLNYRLKTYDEIAAFKEWRRLFSPQSVPDQYWLQVLGAKSAAMAESARAAAEERRLARSHDRAAISNISKFKLVGEISEPLTPKLMADAVIPYLLAVADLQRIIDEIQEHPTAEVTIQVIKQGSISVSLGGADGAIETIKNTIIPWRRKHQAEMARIAEQKGQVEIEIAKATVLEIRARAELARAETKLKQAEEENTRQETQLDRARLGLEVMKQIQPNMTEEQKLACFTQLLGPLEVLVDSSLEIAGGDKK